MRGLAALCAASLACGCSLALPYPALGSETDPVLCTDGIDNDGNGLTDCDDPSCARCVAPPRITCPEGWTTSATEGATSAATCVPPDDLTTAGCLEAAPPGSVVAPAGIGMLIMALRTLPPSPDPSAPPLVVYLAPGMHVESGVGQLGHVALHGICDGGVPPTLAPGPGVESPVGGALAIDIDHIDLVIDPAFGTAMHAMWTGALTLTHARMRAQTADGTVAQVGGMGITLDHARIDVPLHFGADGRLVARDSVLRSVSGRVDADLVRVALAGDLSLGEIGAGTPHVVATSLFVACGSVALAEGANAELHQSAITIGRYGSAMHAGGRAGFRASVSLEDVSMTFDPTCLDAPPVALGYTDSDVQMRRVLVSDAMGLFFGRHTIAELHDVTVLGPTASVGIDVRGASCTADRVSVSGVQLAGVRVSGDPSAGADGIATLRRCYVDSVTPTANACWTPTGAGILVGPLFGGILAGDPQQPRVSLAEADVRGVQGCALFVDPLAQLDVARTVLADSAIGLCAPSRADTSELTSALVLDGNASDVSTDGSLCAGPNCGPTPCAEAGACTNGVDDDGDGATDCADTTDCGSDPACMRAMFETDCHDGGDNDRDGLVDCADPDCTGQCPDIENCMNAIDDDHDGLIDCADPDCASTCPPRMEDCANGTDDDGDGLVDCADPDCAVACMPHEICANGLDDDHDGLTDCSDPDCTCACGPPDTCPAMDLGSMVGAGVAHGTLDTSGCSTFAVSCATGAMGAAITFGWTAPSAGSYTFDTFDSSGAGSRFDTVLALRDVTCSGAELACNDDTMALLSSVTTTLSAGQHVVIVLRAYRPVGPLLYTLNITPG